MGDSDHDCLTEIVNATSIRPDLSNVPIQTGDVLFVDGSCSKPSDGVYLCGYAVCRLPNTVLESFSLPFSSTQGAELFALTRACVLADYADVTIYTDSRYAFRVAHDFGRIWQSRGFTAADGKPISHASLVQDLITACHLPHSVAIVKTRAHSSGDTDEVRGNSFADQMAKQAAASRPLPPNLSPAMFSVNTMISAVLPDMDLPSLHASASPADREFWTSQGATDSYVILDNKGRVCLPRHCTPFLVREFHGPNHHRQRGVLQDLSEVFCIFRLHTDMNRILEGCLICAQNNISKSGATHQHFPMPDTPFQEWQIDFTHMPRQGPFRYLLVMVDKFSRWVEAFPCNKENARVVVQKLTTEIIPRYGIPVGIDSDKGTPFTSKVTQLLCKELKVNWHFHIPYHPKSSGMVERANRTIKDKIRKAMHTSGSKNWVMRYPLC
ncbi:protein NYNRIN-like [Tachysurus fulvidraco]|uniref:protein NYNRIN-like n=1 Tax=Tachysurus fulvidraco TaxID=1234273 RepID=UPI001FEE729F|nr:protein NYNRIN-like [Tachysurus fulvidraco]